MNVTFRSRVGRILGPVVGMWGIVACDVVDETGWVCLDGTIVDDPQQCMDRYADEAATDSDVFADSDDAEMPPGAVEGSQDLVWYTSPWPIGVEPGPVTVIGLPGANPAGGPVSLVVDGARAIEAQIEGTSFVGLVYAQLGSEVTVVAGGVELAHVAIDGSSPAQGLDAQPSSPLATAEDTDAAGGGVGGARTLEVGDGRIPFPAPYLVYNETSGEVAVVQQGTFEATLTVWPGDRACVVAIAPNGASGPPTCQTF
ncbi:MAG TPA: hypothetical protein PKA64_09470 [Myxococcota bacterium]|nr:hypothetical protein [Myxococcota bacterium]